MPTEYKPVPGSSRGKNWNEDHLKKAIDAVKNGASVKSAAKQHGVPRSTLRHRINAGFNETKGRMGPDSILGAKNEEKLVNHILKSQKAGFPFTRDDLRQLAFQFAEKLGIKHKFNKEAGKAGYDWLSSFLRRHRQLTIRQAENVSIARAKAVTREEVDSYFKVLEEILTKNNLLNKPSCIYNVDETGLQLNSRAEEVIAEKGCKSVSSVSSSERGETVTVVACCNAEGVFLPPIAIMKGKNLKAEWKDNMPPGSDILMSEKSAYVNAELFYRWLREYFLPRKPEGNVLLILDGHVSHCNSIEMLEFAEENDIILFCLPSHTTHFLQPLDRSFFKSLKSAFYKALNTWQKRNIHRKVSRFQFGQLLSEGWSKSATFENGSSGFRATGIFPFNPSAIPDYAFLQNTCEFETREAEILQRNNEMREQLVPENVPIDTSNEAPSTSKQSPTTFTTPMQPIQSEEIPKDSPSKLLQTISPIPSIVATSSTQRSRRKIGATELTSRANIEKGKRKLKEKLAKGNKTQKKKASAKHKRKVESSSSCEDSDGGMQLDDGGKSPEIYSDLEPTDNTCVACKEDYNTTKSKDDWFQCVFCNKWLHDGCSTFKNICNPCGWTVAAKK